MRILIPGTLVFSLSLASGLAVPAFQTEVFTSLSSSSRVRLRPVSEVFCQLANLNSRQTRPSTPIHPTNLPVATPTHPSEPSSAWESQRAISSLRRSVSQTTLEPRTWITPSDSPPQMGATTNADLATQLHAHTGSVTVEPPSGLPSFFTVSPSAGGSQLLPSASRIPSGSVVAGATNAIASPGAEETQGHDLVGTSESVGKTPNLAHFKTAAIVIAILAALASIVFLIIDPRVSSTCRRKRISSKAASRRISSWFPFPTPAARLSPRKPVDYEKEGFGSFERPNTRAMPSPRSKFSVTSSDYSQRHRVSNGSSADSILAENTRANGVTTPVRPARPPTIDSPDSIPDDVYFASESRVYMDSPPNSTGTMPNSSGAFFTTGAMRSPNRYALPSTLMVPSIDALEGSRHLRTHSAPLFTGNPCPAPFVPWIHHLDPVARRVLQHRRSRSTSGWAYPRKPQARMDSDDETYEGGSVQVN
ncbi:hypothetical protein BKA70DRAFT_1416021 [Coprinopsis sp. MPI-PUGE-AT-0042]|nr:hypothetical protein BKA70DRAFT_1416021 [Coprinopsis sp. MPI-PUGE-AT-0042]